MDILPAIDLREGKCVRLLQGDYNKQIDYSNDPVAVAKQFEQLGARWLHVVDLDGAREGNVRNLPVIEGILKGTNLSLEVGGGLRWHSRWVLLILRHSFSYNNILPLNCCCCCSSPNLFVFGRPWRWRK